jgi:hypothetical protein
LNALALGWNIGGFWTIGQGAAVMETKITRLPHELQQLAIR